MTPADWTKPFVPSAPRAKFIKHGSAWPVGTDGVETAPVTTPETPAPAAAVGPNALAPVVRLNRNVSFTGQSRSTVSEPSSSQWNNTVLFTHNWDGAVSSDGGRTWSRRDPRRFASVDGGFCCDQYTVHVPVSGKQVTLWLLQYGYSTSTQKNVQRIACYRSETELQNGTIRYWDFSPSLFGFSSTHWLDFPHMSYGNNYAYATTNVFKRESNGTNTYAGVVCWRMSLTNLKSISGGLPFQYIRRTSNGRTWRLAQGIKNTAYWWQLESGSQGRLYWWPESGTTVSSKTISLSTFSFINNAVARDLQNRNFMGRASTRPLAGWVGKGQIGFAWNAGTRSGRPTPYTRFVMINESTRNKIRDYDVWNSTGCWSYPAVGVNARGDVGGVIAFGAPDRYPGSVCWIMDATDTNPLQGNTYFQTGSGGPTRNSWGDYMTVAPHPKYPNSWIGTGMAMNSTAGGNTNQIPRHVWFGRSGDVTVRPDLTVTSLTASTTSLRPLGNTTLTAVVRNQGEATSSSSSRIGWYLSPNSTISTADRLLGWNTISATASHANRTITRTVSIPGDATPGTCYLGAFADYNGASTEEIETNNTRALRATCLTPIADLIVSAFQASPTSFRRGQSVAVQSIVRNTGNKASTACTSGYYLSTNSTISTGDTLLRSFSTPALNPNVSAPTNQSSVTIPVTSPIGTCYLGAYADRTNAVSESSTANNGRSQQVVCQDGTPDLQISALTTSRSVSGGASITVSATTANRGTGVAPASTTGVLLSTNTTISAADDLIGVYSVASLNPNQTSSRSANYFFPRCYTGTTAYIGAWADVNSQITELNEANNTRASAAVTVAPYSGAGRYLEWRGRINTAASNTTGAASFGLGSGPRLGYMCVTAPRNVGDWHLLLWSGSSSFTLDAFTDLSLGLLNGPVLPGFLSRIPSSGRTYPRMNLPAAKGIPALRIYTYSAWFDANFTTFGGFGSNSIQAIVRS